MSIDWFTVIAQIINFLILVYLIRRFLFKPILNVIDAREKQVADTIADAEKIKENAEETRNHFRQLNENLENDYKNLLDKARDKAQQEYKDLMEKARKDAIAFVEKQRGSQKENAEKFKQTIQLQAKEEIFTVLQKILSDLANTSLDTQIINAFLERLKNLSDDEKKQIALVKKTLEKEALVQTSCDLSLEQKQLIKEAVRKLLGSHIQIQFKTKQRHLVSGIKLIMGGREISWNIDRYLESLAEKIDRLLDLDQSKLNE